MKKAFILICLSLYMQLGFSQPLLDMRLDQTPITEAIQQLSTQSGISIAFSSRFFPANQKISLDIKQKSLEFILEQLLLNTGIGYKWRKNKLALFRLKDRTFTVHGYVSDKSSGEKLVGASVYIPSMKLGTYTNAFGYFSLSLPEGTYPILFSYTSYAQIQRTLSLRQDQRLEIEMLTDLSLETVLITAENDQGFQAGSIGQHKLNKEILAISPTLGGEEDIVNQLKLLPGVQYGTDGLGGLHIRGGNNSQNLMLLDGVPVYNPSHLLGIFSIYNASAIRSASLLKGNIPARYGGRLSSVLDVRTRDGNQKEWTGELGLGLLSAQATVEGPFQKDKGSLLISGRSTTLNALLLPTLNRAFGDGQKEGTEFYFFDFNAKLNYMLSPSDRIYLSFYRGGDSFHQEREGIGEDETEESQENELSWGNTITALRWNHLFGNRLFSNLTLTHSFYQFQNGELSQRFSTNPGGDDSFSFYNFKSEVRDLAALLDFSLYPSLRHHINFGGGFTHHTLNPEVKVLDEEAEEVAELETTDFQSLSDLDIGPNFDASEGFLYIEDHYRPTTNWLFTLGGRYSFFITEDKTYTAFEPRLFGRYAFKPKWTAQFSVGRTVQYLHQLSATGLSLPSDIWMPSTNSLEPQAAWQSELGLQFSADQWAFSLSAYARQMEHQYAVSDSTAFLSLEEDGEEELNEGYGNVLGLELMLEKTLGKSGGAISYTWSKAERQVDFVNNGKNYPYQYDHRHRLNIFLFHKIRPALTFSLNWVYGSGNPRLVVQNTENIQDYQLAEIDPEGEKNSVRSTPYHHLDLNLSYRFRHKQTEHRFKLGVYNLYNRKNVSFYRLHNPQTPQQQLEAVYLMPVLPSFSYFISF